MRLLTVDILAIHGTSFLHKTHPGCKLLATVFVLGAILSSHSSYLLLVTGLIMSLTLHYLLSFTLSKQLLLAGYPLFFSLAYGAILGLAGESQLLVSLRAVVAVLTLAILITTTPYIKLFGVMGRFLPQVLVDIFFLTYRCFFLFIKSLQELLQATGLRGGLAGVGLGRRLANMANYLGFAFVKAADINERSYWLMVARGYNGGIQTGDQGALRAKDVSLVLGALGLLVAAVGLNRI